MCESLNHILNNFRLFTFITSALQDSRFPPINVKELPKLSCAVSLLTDFEPGKDYLDWDIGKHGIWIEFAPDDRFPDKTTTATYLPEVIPEQGWNKVQAIDSLLRKGGYTGPITDKKRKSIKLTRYQSQKLEKNYKDYLKAEQNKKLQDNPTSTLPN